MLIEEGPYSIVLHPIYAGRLSQSSLSIHASEGWRPQWAHEIRTNPDPEKRTSCGSAARSARLRSRWQRRATCQGSRSLDFSGSARGGRVAERAMRQRISQHFQGIDLSLRCGAFKVATAVCRTLRTAFALNEH